MPSPQFVCLHSNEASLVLEPCADGPPLWRHFGLRVDPTGLAPLADQRTAASFSLDREPALSCAPPSGLGWFGPPLVVLRRNGTGLVGQFGAAEVEADAAEIRFRIHDQLAGLTLEQTIGLDPGGAFRFSARLLNCGSEALVVDWLASALLPLAMTSTTLVSWRGRHDAELVELVEPMPGQAWQRETRRGIPGHGGPPGVVVMSEGASDHAGLVLSLQLAWSGDNRIAVERSDEGQWLLSGGLVPQPGEIVLAPGDSHAAPEAIVAVSGQGRNGALAQHHAAVRHCLDWPGGTMRPRPVHLNSWEACYFDHDEQRIGELAEAAAAIGVERFILDDGWFRGRNNDTAGLGDWSVDPIKYPAGLKPLADRVIALGMEFGLWVEPEMVNSDSDLYRAHPDWALALPGRERPTARNQLVLDLRRDEVRDHLFIVLDTLLSEVPIAYLKWDHNRDLAPAGGASQVRGTYELLARLRAAHPLVEIESCAGGGGRCDAGIAKFIHRFWTSDNIDAVSRVPMQRGFLNFLPPEAMGTHVGASPAHVTGRVQSLGFRAAVALPGHFGLELDPRKLEPRDHADLTGWIVFYKQWRHLLHGGRTWLGHGADGLVWQAVGSPQEYLLFVIRSGAPLDRRPQLVALPFLAECGHCAVQLLRIGGGERGYPAATAPLFEEMRSQPQIFAGNWLGHAGLPMPPLKAESAAIFHGKACV